MKIYSLPFKNGKKDENNNTGKVPKLQIITTNKIGVIKYLNNRRNLKFIFLILILFFYGTCQTLRF